MLICPPLVLLENDFGADKLGHPSFVFFLYEGGKLCGGSRLMPFRPLFPCVPWSRGTNNITLK